jgi:hypothetical protein
LRDHLKRRPRDNPFVRFGSRFTAELPGLQDQGLPQYHAWAFANLRQIGAAFELAGLHARWLEDGALKGAAESFEIISTQAKTLILKAARAVNAKRALDAAPFMDAMADAWERAMGVLVREVA